jgi:flagellar hook-associated protein 3 FlgL
MIYQRGVNAMLRQQSQLSDTQMQISTGRRIITASDDPAGATRVIDYNRKIETLEQYLKNADRVETRLEREEVAIAETENILLRVRDLTVQGSSDILSPEQRDFIAIEIRGLREQLIGLSNTRDAHGEYIFAGYQSGTKPFDEPVAGTVVYYGDLGDRQLQISDERLINDGNNGHEVFVDVETTTGKRSLFDTLEQIATDLEADLSPAAYLDDVDLALAHTSTIRSTIGGRLSAIEEQVAVNEEAKLILETHRSGEEDLDFAEAISRLDRQRVALEAAQKAYIRVSQLSLFNYL